MLPVTLMRDISRLRLRVQRVEGASFESAAAVVGGLLAVQSQEAGLAKWSLGMRSAQGSEAAVDEALAEGAVLRTHILRPTWHYVLPADIRWLMRLTAPRVKRLSVGRWTQLALDASTFARACDAIARRLEGGRHATRAELADELDRAGVAREGQRLAWILMSAELDLLICSGAPRGRKETYALLDERAPARAGADGADDADHDELLARLALRFFASHGPATAADLAWWASLTLTEARRGLAASAPQLERLTVDGTDYWWAGAPADARPSPRAHLLQAYDELIVGYRSPRDEINLERLAPAGVLPRPSFHSSILLDGQVVAFWRRLVARAGEGFIVETRPARALRPREQRALADAIARYQAFLDKPVVTIGGTTGPAGSVTA